MSGNPMTTMKTFGAALTLFALALAAIPARAQSSYTGNEMESLRVIDKYMPVYPYELLQLGVREGEVRVALSVDKTGKIDDILAVAYTHPEFAKVTVDAIKHWTFAPARYRGEPIAAATEIAVKFAVEGTVVISLTPLESLNLRIYSMFNSSPDAYRPHSLSELDRIPTPIAAPSPGYPERMTKPGASGKVTVSFYIDETGAVRLPSVDVTEDPELAAAAIDALRNWKFEPPTCKGRPVLVRATQPFNFRAPSPKQTAANR